MHHKESFVIITRKLPSIIETRMMELFKCRLNLSDKAMERDGLIKAVQEADILVPTVTDKIDKEVIEAAGTQLKLIASFGAGVDHIDLSAAYKRGITVTNTPDVLTEDTADITMALILATPRRLVEGEMRLRNREWHGWSPTSMLGRRIYGKKLGIIGMGRIGQAVARRAQGFGLSIHYHNRNPLSDWQEKELKATYWSSLDRLLAHMDIISINCPKTPSTYHLLNKRRLELVQSHSYIVNTSRGEVIDEASLVKQLKRGEIAGAGLDVYENEPALHPGFLSLKNVVLLPHMGSATIEARVEMGERVLINIKTFIDGHRPPDRVLNTLF